MTNIERAIKGLEICYYPSSKCENCPYHDLPDGQSCTNQLLRDALTILKEQEAVKPIVDIDIWKCGNCGHTLEHQELFDINVLFHEQYNYCPECGKKVKWNA